MECLESKIHLADLSDALQSRHFLGSVGLCRLEIRHFEMYDPSFEQRHPSSNENSLAVGLLVLAGSQ